MKKPVVALVLACLMCGCATSGQGVRLTFLDTDETRNDTMSLLRKAGCKEETTQRLSNIIAHHRSAPMSEELPLFPPKSDGYYHFASVEELIQRLNGKTLGHYGEPQPSLNCFLFSFLALRDVGFSASLIGERFTEKFFVDIQSKTNSHAVTEWEKIGKTEDFRLNGIRAVPYLRLEDLRKNEFRRWGAKGWLNNAFTEDTVNAFYSMRTFRHFPESPTTKQLTAKQLWSWKSELYAKDGLIFPKRLQVALFHYMCGQSTAIDHIVLVVPHNGRFVCVEKTSTYGPYVRIDFNTTKEIGQYIVSGYKEFCIKYKQLGFVTLNEKLLCDFDPTKKSTVPSNRAEARPLGR